MDVEEAEVPCKGMFSPTDIPGVWAEIKFRMFGYVLIPRLRPIPLSRFVLECCCQVIPLKFSCDLVYTAAATTDTA